MTTKEYLNQIRSLDGMIQSKLSEICRLKNAATSTTAAIKEVNVQTSPDHDRMGSAIAKIADLERETDFLVDAFVDLKKEAYQKISLLKNPKHKYILIQKYIKYKSIYAIAEELGMSDRGCKKAHKKAIEEIGKINKNTIYCIMLDSSLLNVVK